MLYWQISVYYAPFMWKGFSKRSFAKSKNIHPSMSICPVMSLKIFVCCIISTVRNASQLFSKDFLPYPHAAEDDITAYQYNPSNKALLHSSDATKIQYFCVKISQKMTFSATDGVGHEV